MDIRVLLADDHSVLRDGLEAMLHAQPGIAVVGHAADGREAVRKALELAPDVTIMDIVMPELDGIEATHRVRSHLPQSRVVILSMYSTTEHIFRALHVESRRGAGTRLVATVGRQ